MNTIVITYLIMPSSDSSTTRCRVVFDGSNKTTSGVALNQTLAIGPTATIQRDLQSILINFRWYKYGLCGDIEKMYRQIEVQTADQNYQRILWREKPGVVFRNVIVDRQPSHITI